MNHLYIICTGRQDYPKIMTILLILGALCLAWQRGIFVFRTNGKSQPHPIFGGYYSFNKYKP